MPAETKNTSKFLENSENLYEVVMVIAKRARQINEDQFQRMRDRQPPAGESTFSSSSSSHSSSTSSSGAPRASAPRSTANSSRA